LKENPIKGWKLDQTLKNAGTTQKKDHLDGGSQKIGQTNNQPLLENNHKPQRRLTRVDEPKK